MKTNCDIIRDLLPLYAEHITSEATNALVEEHLAAGSGPPCKEGASVQRSALCWQPCALWQ